MSHNDGRFPQPTYDPLSEWDDFNDNDEELPAWTHCHWCDKRVRTRACDRIDNRLICGDCIEASVYGLYDD